MKLDSRYAGYFTEYLSYFGRALRLLKSMFGNINLRKVFADGLTEWLAEAGLIKSQYQMSIYYKHTPYRTNIVALSYVDGCVYWYIAEALVKWFVDTLGRRFNMNLLEYAHWFTSIRISKMNDHSISVYQDSYSTSIVAKYMDTATVNTSTKFYKANFPSGMIFTKDDTPTSDEKF